MKRRATYTITPGRISNAFYIDGVSHFTEFLFRDRMKEMGEVIPDTEYQVTFSLAPKTGKFVCNENNTTNAWQLFRLVTDESHCLITNCLLPREWAGLRFNRSIKVL